VLYIYNTETIHLFRYEINTNKELFQSSSCTNNCESTILYVGPGLVLTGLCLNIKTNDRSMLGY